MTIDTYADHTPNHVLPLLREIFFLSADPRNVSEDPVKNEAFFDKWTSYYLKNRTDWILLAWEESKLLGYLMCEPDSAKALPYYQLRNSSYALFQDQFAEFPAHLHMNSHPQARGKGVGSGLVEESVKRLRVEGVSGVHLITAPNQRNVAFYRKNGFDHEVQREWRSFPLLFMGRKI